MVHETHRIAASLEEAPPSSREALKTAGRGYARSPARFEPPGSRPSLAPGLKRMADTALVAKPTAGTPLEADREAGARSSRRLAARRGDGVRLSQRVMDVEAHRHVGPQEVRGPLPPESPLARSTGVRVSCRCPNAAPSQRDEEAIAHWMRYTWPAIKKSAKAWRPHRLPR